VGESIVPEPSAAEASIVPYEDAHAADFDRLNRAWLVEHGLLEEPDLPHLLDPRGTIIDGGGAIFVALLGDEVIGTCGIHPAGDGDFELIKLAVDPRARGGGLGRRLVERCVDFARAAGARRVTLLSSRKLASALRLYAALGFRHEPMPASIGYATADVFMAREL
jgi:GNAT superfamily N-acetyltransferase